MAGKGQIQPRWQKGESGNPAGRPKGALSRSTIAKKWLEVNQNLKNPITGANEQLSQEDLMTLAQIKKAREGDTQAYKALLDSAYGVSANIKIEHDYSDMTDEEIAAMLEAKRKEVE